MLGGLKFLLVSEELSAVAMSTSKLQQEDMDSLQYKLHNHEI
jgi:hypothetical protein